MPHLDISPTRAYRGLLEIHAPAIVERVPLAQIFPSNKVSAAMGAGRSAVGSRSTEPRVAPLAMISFFLVPDGLRYAPPGGCPVWLSPDQGNAEEKAFSTSINPAGPSAWCALRLNDAVILGTLRFAREIQFYSCL